MSCRITGAPRCGRGPALRERASLGQQGRDAGLRPLSLRAGKHARAARQRARAETSTHPHSFSLARRHVAMVTAERRRRHVGALSRGASPRALLLMASMSMSMPRAREELRAACRQCSERGLRSSSKWAAEQLVGLRALSAETPGDAEMSSAVGEADAEEAEEEMDNVYLAKAYFDSNEFLRAAHVLRGASAARGRFLRWYSLFLAGEKRKDERMLEESGNGSGAVPTGKPRAVNEQLVLLQSELQPEAEAGRLDGFCQYIYGLTLRELQRPQEACTAFKQAASMCPCFWAAWTELAASLPDLEALAALELPNHWMVYFFRAHAALEAQQNVQASARARRSPRRHHTARALARLARLAGCPRLSSLTSCALSIPPSWHRRSTCTKSCLGSSPRPPTCSASSPTQSTTFASSTRRSCASSSCTSATLTGSTR